MLRRRSKNDTQDQEAGAGEDIAMRPTGLFRRSKKRSDLPEDSASQDQSKADDSAHANFKPNRFFHIPSHNGLSKTVKVFPIPSDTLSTQPVGSDAYKAKAKSIGEAYKNLPKGTKETNAGSAYLTASKSKWYQRTLTISLPLDSETSIAEWRGGAFSTSKNVISFPVESPYCSHDITQKVDSFWKFREKFVVDSVPYLWSCNNLFSELDFSLYKMVGGQKIECARFYSGFKFVQTTGVLAVNEEEVESVVAVLTCLAVLRKKRQRDEERRS